MRIMDRCKNMVNACKNTGKYVYSALTSKYAKWSAFVFLSFGKTVGSSAQANYNVVKAIDYCEHITIPKGQSPHSVASSLGLIIGGVSLIASAWGTLMTRVPLIHKKIFGDPIEGHQQLLEPSQLQNQNLLQDEERGEENSGRYCIIFSIRSVAMASGLFSAGFAAFNQWFTGRKLTEFIFTLASMQSNDEEWKKNLNIFFPAVLVTSSLFSFFAFNFREINKSAEKMASNVFKEKSSSTKKMIQITVLFSIFNSISSAVISYFNTKDALLDHFQLADDTADLIAITTILSQIITGIFTASPAIYDWIHSNYKFPSLEGQENTKCMQLTTNLTYLFGITDSCTMSLGGFKGAVEVLGNHGQDLYGPLALSFGSICALTAFLSNLTFNVSKGYQRSLEYKIHCEKTMRLLADLAARHSPSIQQDQIPVSIMEVRDEEGSDAPYHQLENDEKIFTCKSNNESNKNQHESFLPRSYSSNTVLSNGNTFFSRYVSPSSRLSQVSCTNNPFSIN